MKTLVTLLTVTFVLGCFSPNREGLYKLDPLHYKMELNNIISEGLKRSRPQMLQLSLEFQKLISEPKAHVDFDYKYWLTAIDSSKIASHSVVEGLSNMGEFKNYHMVEHYVNYAKKSDSLAYGMELVLKKFQMAPFYEDLEVDLDNLVTINQSVVISQKIFREEEKKFQLKFEINNPTDKE